MTAGVLPIRISRLRPMRDGAIVACLVLALGHALGLLQLGVDAHAYWAADPFDPYGGTRPGDQDAYFYAPPFAQLLGPLHLLPWRWFIAIWTLLLSAAFIWQAWYWAGFLILTVPVFAELTVGNIHLLLAAAIVAGFRWPWLWALPLLTKSTLGVGLLWFAVRREWRQLAVALGATVLVVAASFAVAPRLWFQWPEILEAAVSAPERPFVILVAFPVRVAAAVALVVWGALTDRRWTVPVASMLALPILWVNGLAMLVAVLPLVPRLVGDSPASRWLARGTTVPVRLAPAIGRLERALDRVLPPARVPERA
ncbi:MAG: glycosyltransferase family 87 protein [Chloroflexota bacterium]